MEKQLNNEEASSWDMVLKRLEQALGVAKDDEEKLSLLEEFAQALFQKGVANLNADPPEWASGLQDIRRAWEV